MKLFAAAGWMTASLVPSDLPATTHTAIRTQPMSSQTEQRLLQQRLETTFLNEGVSSWLLAAAAPEPSAQDVALLRSAFAEFYGVNRDLDKSETLLSETIDKWQRQPADERAGLYRVRGDCYVALGNADKAYRDYDTAVTLLGQPGVMDAADPSELPAALLGRARAALAQKTATTNNNKLATQTVTDYQTALRLSSRDDYAESDDELLEDGATRNPYAAWELGTALRWTGDWSGAATAHARAAQAFDGIGDKARSVVALLDAGIDLAATGGKEDVAQAEVLLRKGVGQTTGVSGRDVALLQRVILKEGEGRIALAATLWSDGQRPEAERVLGDACVRLDQLSAQMDTAAKKAAANADPNALSPPVPLKFSIDDTMVPGLSCGNFRNPQFVKDTLGWPESLQQKVVKLQTLR